MYFLFSWSSHQWFSYLCVLSPWWRQGSIGIFHFSVLAILRSIFRVLHWKTSVNYSLLSIAVCGFMVFQHWFSVFFRIWCVIWFSVFYVLSITSYSADTVMIHVLIFSMKTDVILYSTCSTHHQHFRSIWFLKTFDGFVLILVFSYDQNLLRVSVLGDLLAIFLF